MIVLEVLIFSREFYSLRMFQLFLSLCTSIYVLELSHKKQMNPCWDFGCTYVVSTEQHCPSEFSAMMG